MKLNFCFAHKRGTIGITPLEIFALAVMEYRTTYQNGKWTAFNSDPDSWFYVNESARYGGRDVLEMQAAVDQAEEEQAEKTVTVVVDEAEHLMGNTTTVEG